MRYFRLLAYVVDGFKRTVNIYYRLVYVTSGLLTHYYNYVLPLWIIVEVV
nr:MAG TPA: hypothetical protein [Caudoviricetes sp.]